MRKGNAFLLLAESRDQREKRANLLVFTIRQDSGKRNKRARDPTRIQRYGRTAAGKLEKKYTRVILTAGARKSIINENEE